MNAKVEDVLKATYIVKIKNSDYNMETEIVVTCYENSPERKYRYSIVTDTVVTTNFPKVGITKRGRSVRWVYNHRTRQKANEKFAELMKQWKDKNAEITKL